MRVSVGHPLTNSHMPSVLLTTCWLHSTVRCKVCFGNSPGVPPPTRVLSSARQVAALPPLEPAHGTQLCWSADRMWPGMQYAHTVALPSGLGWQPAQLPTDLQGTWQALPYFMQSRYAAFASSGLSRRRP